MNRTFAWDPAKERENIAKHGVDFGTATSVFDDPALVLVKDDAHSVGEQRYFAFGFVAGAVLTVRCTLRGETIRLIGAGYWRKGREYYEEANRLYR
jgi:uncharacterized DUF497 family protein